MTGPARPSANLGGAPPGDGVVERDESSLPLDKVVFGVAATMIVLFVAYGALRPEAFSTQTSEALGWLTGNFGWLFVLTSAFFVLFAGYLAVSRYGQHQARARRLRAGVHDVLVGLDDVRHRAWGSA